METNLYNQVITKIFVGYPLNAEVSLKLHQSRLWQDKDLNPATAKLIEIQNHGKAYLGQLLDVESITIEEIRSLAAEIKEFIAHSCQNYEMELEKVCIFPQVFVV